MNFDNLCETHGVTKIETVGKTYMACAGLKDSEVALCPELLAKNHAQRAVSLAIDVIKKVEKFDFPSGQVIKVKIGVNSGPVIAGVVGD